MRPRVLDGHVGGILQAEGIRLKNKAMILTQYDQIGPAYIPGYSATYVLNQV